MSSSSSSDTKLKDDKATAEQKIVDADSRREAARIAREIRRKEAEEEAKEKIIQAAAATAAYSQDFVSRGVKLAEAPEGVPSILSWAQRPDGKEQIDYVCVCVCVRFLLLSIRSDLN